MDPVFDAQYLRMKDPFNADGIEIAVARTYADQIDYVYVKDELLTLRENVQVLRDALPRLDAGYAREREQPAYGDLVRLHIGGEGHFDGDGHLTVPEALDLIERRLGRDRMFLHGQPLATPVHIVHTAKLCAATEPEVPCCPDPGPCPPPAGDCDGLDGILLGISDTGLWEQPPVDQHSWMVGVLGEDDPPEPGLIDGQLRIPYEGGHGTMVAGVARCTAPGVGVYVANNFSYAGGTIEWQLAQGLERLIAEQSPQLINLSAGGYTWRDIPPQSFTQFRQRHPDVTLVAAAGNDSTTRPFYPAALDWTIAVGALGADRQNLAWFSNHGPWVDVYALGEGLINAYATGVYTYHEPPKRPARQVFRGMARWSGTSCSTPMVAGLIAAEMARSGSSAADAWQAVLDSASSSDFGPVLLPPA